MVERNYIAKGGKMTILIEVLFLIFGIIFNKIGIGEEFMN